MLECYKCILLIFQIQAIFTWETGATQYFYTHTKQRFVKIEIQNTKSIQNMSSHFEYHKNQLCHLDITCPQIKNDTLL